MSTKHLESYCCSILTHCSLRKTPCIRMVFGVLGFCTILWDHLPLVESSLSDLGMIVTVDLNEVAEIVGSADLSKVGLAVSGA